jgi:hypothetical protein
MFFLPAPSLSGTADLSYADYGAAAVRTLESVWYANGQWRQCLLAECRRANADWGADVLTYALALRWRTAHDPDLQPYLAGLAGTFRRYAAPCASGPCRLWSDVPAWDAVAALRVFEAVHDARALAAARAAFDAADRSPVYALGACPAILYQRAFGEETRLKTLETDSNLLKASLLLYRSTGETRYLTSAIARYASVRRAFLDPEVPLYTVYIFDDGKTCRQVPHRFYASVNGNMIDAGLRLHDATGDEKYLRDALATASAVDASMTDERGVFVDQQAENDVAEPLIEAMFELATKERQLFARDWILKNAEASVSARTADGNFGRFFDGPPPAGPVTAWQTNGGLALMIAAAALAPDAVPAGGGWDDAKYVARDASVLPLSIAFTGSAIALIGTIGDRCCESGHARVFLDGIETFDRRGVWQNKSSSDRRLRDSVLFAWRWRAPGPHVVEIQPAPTNAKEGKAYFHLTGYLLK